MPEVSVVIPTYNYARFLPQAIESVLGQTFGDFDLHVVDDGSTDDTAAVVEAYRADPRVRYWYQTNGGDATARNRGIAASRGRYLAFLDADDHWSPTKLERQMGAVRGADGPCVVYTAAFAEVVDQEGRVTASAIHRSEPWRYATLVAEILMRRPITGSHSGVLVPRECLDVVGLFEPGLLAGDKDMWLRLAVRYPFVYIDEPLVTLRLHARSQSRDLVRMAADSLLYHEAMRRGLPTEHRGWIAVAVVKDHVSYAWQFLRRRRLARAAPFVARALLEVTLNPSAVPRLIAAMRDRRERRAMADPEWLAARRAVNSIPS